MDSLFDIVGLMLFGIFITFIASNKTARFIISNIGLPRMLAKTKEQKERIEARTKMGFLAVGIIIILAAFLLLIRHLLK